MSYKRNMPQKPQKITVIGGGTGTYTVLTALKDYNVYLSAIVSMCDDGGSTGKLRDEYGVLPPGDIRRSLIALSSADAQVRKLFEYRFETGELKGHNFGNIFLTALEKATGSFYEAVKIASRELKIQGEVIPVTLDNVKLHAELENGRTIRGETNIDIPKHNPKLKIIRIFLEPQARANKDAVNAILAADSIIIGPGDLYTSVLPNFLVSGITEAIKKSKARKIYVCNLMTKHGETNGYALKDFIGAVEKYVGPAVIDYILVNTGKPTQARLKKYAEENAELVSVPKNFKYPGLVRADLATKNDLVRHDTKKLGKTIIGIICQ